VSTYGANKNYDAIIGQKATQQAWYTTISKLNQKFDLGLVSTVEFAAKLGLTQAHTDNLQSLVRIVFENNVKPFFTGVVVTTVSENNLSKAFARYM